MITALTGNPFKGAFYFFRAIPWLTAKGIWPLVLIPAMLSGLIYVALVYFAYQQIHQLFLSAEQLPTWVAWLMGWFRPVLWLVFFPVVVLFITYTFSMLTNLIGGAFNSVLSEQVERRLTGRPLIETPLISAIHLIVPCFISELKKLATALRWMALLTILSFMPIVSLIAPPLWLLFSAWNVALEYIAYPMDNHNIFFQEQRKLYNGKRLTVLGFGGMVFMAKLIPVANFLVMPLAVIAATLLSHTEWREELSSPWNPHGR